jgi:hypothetical protein
MLSESQHFMQSVMSHGIQGAHVGSGPSSVSYGTYKDCLNDSELFSFMMQSPIQWLDLGYLKRDGHINFMFTDKVEEDRHILIRMMEKQQCDG